MWKWEKISMSNAYWVVLNKSEIWFLASRLFD